MKKIGQNKTPVCNCECDVEKLLYGSTHSNLSACFSFGMLETCGAAHWPGHEAATGCPYLVMIVGLDGQSKSSGLVANSSATIDASI